MSTHCQGPEGLPIVGSLFDLKCSLSKAGDDAYFHQLLLKYGPIAKVTVMGATTAIILYNLDSSNISGSCTCL